MPLPPMTVRVASFVLFAGLAACSGAAPQEVEMAAPSSPGASSSGAVGTTSSTANDAGSSHPGTTGDPVAQGEDGGSSTFGSPAPQACPPGGVVESGGNDSESSAQEFTTVGCGTLLPGASDWWRFRLPATATKLAIDFSGKVTLAATTKGITTAIGSGAALPFNPTANYDIQVTSSHADAEPYVILVETN
jgi:hypothetical protein